MNRIDKLIDIHNSLSDVLDSMIGVIGDRDIREHIMIAMDKIEDEIDELRLEEGE